MNINIRSRHTQAVRYPITVVRALQTLNPPKPSLPLHSLNVTRSTFTLHSLTHANELLQYFQYL